MPGMHVRCLPRCLPQISTGRYSKIVTALPLEGTDVVSRLGSPAAVELADNFVDDCGHLLVRYAAFLAAFDDLAIERDLLSPIRHPRLARDARLGDSRS